MKDLFGKPLFSATPLQPATIAVVGPRKAMAEVLREYLLRARFRVFGDQAADTEFQLNEVTTEWPDARTPLRYPTASVMEQTDTFYEAHNFVPTALDDTLGEFDCPPNQDPPQTVLWKVAEAQVEFQVDFWTSNRPDRQAIAAELGQLFNPGQERSGVLLGGHPQYFRRPVRATLLSHRRTDVEAAVYPNERRLQCAIRCELDIVQLRFASLLTPLVNTQVVDPNDPPEENAS